VEVWGGGGGWGRGQCLRVEAGLEVLPPAFMRRLDALFHSHARQALRQSISDNMSQLLSVSVPASKTQR
jgi:hypothetical protein